MYFTVSKQNEEQCQDFSHSSILSFTGMAKWVKTHLNIDSESLHYYVTNTMKYDQRKVVRLPLLPVLHEWVSEEQFIWGEGMSTEH